MKRLIASHDTQVYSAAGRFLGYLVQEREAFTAEELRPTQCSECGGPNGHHRSYWVRTGQDSLGTVDGFTRPCSKL